MRHLVVIAEDDRLISNYILWTEEQAMKGWPGGPWRIMVDGSYQSITFLLQVGKLLLYKKVKFIGMVRHPITQVFKKCS